MKKAIVISLKNMMKKTVVVSLLAVCLFLSISLKLPQQICKKMADDLIGQNKNTFSYQISRIFSLHSRHTVYAAMPMENSVKEPVLPTTPIPQIKVVEIPIPTMTPPPQTNLSKPNQTIQVKNHTKKSFDVQELLQNPISYQKDTGDYKVLLVHTHTSECYFPNDRCENPDENMIRVGKEFKKVLEEHGIPTLHITTVHDVPYTTSYKMSLESVTKALKEHPSIEVVIDLHRDAIYGSNNEKVRPITVIDGVETAQVMLVCGTDEGGLPHPDWKENLSFALKVQNEMQQQYADFARPLDVRKERFNTHTTKKSVIFEIGSHGNTLEDALAGARLAAQSVANVLNNAG